MSDMPTAKKVLVDWLRDVRMEDSNLDHFHKLGVRITNAKVVWETAARSLAGRPAEASRLLKGNIPYQTLVALESTQAELLSIYRDKYIVQLSAGTDE